MNHDGAAALFDQRGIADELDCIAQTLLSPKQDGSTVQRRAVPQRLRTRRSWARLCGPAVFVFSPTALEVAVEQPDHGTRETGIAVGIEPYCLLIAGQGFLVTAQCCQDQAKIVMMRSESVGRQLYGLPKINYCLLEAPLPLERDAESAVRPIM